MDQTERFEEIINRTRKAIPLTDVALDPELAEPKSFLKVLKAKHYNWTADPFSKVFGMRFSVKMPPLEQLNSIFYPTPDLDIPIFIFFCLVTKRKVIAHLNVNCPFTDEEYQKIHVDPLVAILNQYESFETKDRYPEWMKKYRNACTIYGLYPKDRIDDLTDCMFRYLDYYLEQAVAASRVEDPGRREQIARFHDQFRDDIRTQDKAQGMIARMIGAEKAKRIFYEITT